MRTPGSAGDDQVDPVGRAREAGDEGKALRADMGGHTGVPQFAGEAAAQSFTRHLK